MFGTDPQIIISALLADSPAESPLDSPQEEPYRWDISYLTDTMSDPVLKAAAHHFLAHLRKNSSAPVKKSTALASLLEINLIQYADRILHELKAAGRVV